MMLQHAQSVRYTDAGEGPYFIPDPQAVTPELVVETITPAMAKEWLKHNVRNRTQNKTVIQRYAREMQRGHWRLTGEAIKFDWNGDLVDGQTRLTAIVESGCTVKSAVIYNVDPEAFMYMDRGRKRTVGDTLGILGEHNRTKLAASATILKHYLDGNILRMANPALIPSTDEIVAVVKAHPGLAEAVTRADTKAMKRLSTPSIMAFLVYLLTEVDAQEADVFFHAMETGVGVMETSPITILRDFLLDARIKRTRLRNDEIAAYTVKAWNAWRRGKPMKNVYWDMKKEGFPRPE